MKSHVRSDWQGAILVCGKCSKKSGDHPKLAKALRRAIGGKGRRARLGVVETRCLGVCPKRGVVVIDTRRPERWDIVPAGTEVEEVLGRLDAAGASTRPSPRP